MALHTFLDNNNLNFLSYMVLILLASLMGKLFLPHQVFVLKSSLKILFSISQVRNYDQDSTFMFYSTVSFVLPVLVSLEEVAVRIAFSTADTKPAAALGWCSGLLSALLSALLLWLYASLWNITSWNRYHLSSRYWHSSLYTSGYRSINPLLQILKTYIMRNGKYQYDTTI